MKLTCIHIFTLLIDTTTCGKTKGECYGPPVPMSGLEAGVIAASFVCVLVFVCCLIAYTYRSHIKKNTLSQRSHGTFAYTTGIQQQQQTYSEPRVAYENPSAYTNATRPIYNNDEKRPPSYESVDRDTRFMHPASSAPMRYVPSQESNFRL